MPKLHSVESIKNRINNIKQANTLPRLNQAERVRWSSAQTILDTIARDPHITPQIKQTRLGFVDSVLDPIERKFGIAVAGGATAFL